MIVKTQKEPTCDELTILLKRKVVELIFKGNGIVEVNIEGDTSLTSTQKTALEKRLGKTLEV